MGCTNNVDAFVSVCGRSIVGANAHAPESHFRDFQSSEFPCFHFVSSTEPFFAPVVDSLRLIRCCGPRQWRDSQSCPDRGSISQKVTATEGAAILSGRSSCLLTLFHKWSFNLLRLSTR